MAWNKPRAESLNEKRGRGKNSRFGTLKFQHFAIVIFSLLAIGIGVWWHAGRSQGSETVGDEDPQDAKPIAEVAPHISTNAVAAKPEKTVEFRKLDNGKIMKYVNGQKAWMFPREDYHGPIHTTRVAHVKSIEEKTFNNPADRQIASLLTIRPGSPIVGGPNYRRSFVTDFLKSYDNPFVVEPDDTDEQKELKRAVAEVKGDLKARYDAGEDIAQIMIDTRDTLRQLAAYKRELESEIARLSRAENVSAADMEDYVAAANKMLEERGAQPIPIRGFLRHQISVLKAREASKQQ